MKNAQDEGLKPQTTDIAASCSGLLSKWEWLAFIGKNGLKLNDFINSPWLDLIDTENITAHFKWFYPLSWLTLFDSIKLISS